MFSILRSWWSRVPQKTRVRLIASVLLVFAGSEVLVLAPFVVDLALTIDLFGMAMIVALIRSSLSVSVVQLVDAFSAVLRPLAATFRALDAVADFGVIILSRWERQYLVVDAVSTRIGVSFVVLSVGVGLTTLAASLV